MSYISDVAITDVNAILEQLTDEDRAAVLRELSDTYCLWCGSEITASGNRRCKCED